MIFVLECFYFFLPAYLANMTPPLLKKAGVLKILAKRVDFGKDYRGISIFGNHKTWRGLAGGTIIGIIIAFLQLKLFEYPFFKSISLVNYDQINILLFGFLISFGALAGDLLFSFLKRRRDLKPGAPWIPFDQIDYVIGSFLFLFPYLAMEYSIWATILILTFFLNIIVNYIGFKIGVNENKF